MSNPGLYLTYKTCRETKGFLKFIVITEESGIRAFNKLCKYQWWTLFKECLWTETATTNFYLTSSAVVKKSFGYAV